MPASHRSSSVRSILAFAVLAALLALATAPAFAHGEGESNSFGTDFGADFGRAADKIVQLAEAIPAEEYGWRPAEGVRSVSEALMHVAAANVGLTGPLGLEAPEGMPEDFEAITDKAEVVRLLKISIDQVKKAAEASSDATLGEKVNLFGREFSRRGVFLILGGHSHEHLGQLIAYARSIGVTPPWSAASPPAAEDADDAGEDAGEGVAEGDG